MSGTSYAQVDVDYKNIRGSGSRFSWSAGASYSHFPIEGSYEILNYDTYGHGYPVDTIILDGNIGLVSFTCGLRFNVYQPSDMFSIGLNTDLHMGTNFSDLGLMLPVYVSTRYGACATVDNESSFGGGFSLGIQPTYVGYHPEGVRETEAVYISPVAIFEFNFGAASWRQCSLRLRKQLNTYKRSTYEEKGWKTESLGMFGVDLLMFIPS